MGQRLLILRLQLTQASCPNCDWKFYTSRDSGPNLGSINERERLISPLTWVKTACVGSIRNRHGGRSRCMFDLEPLATVAPEQQLSPAVTFPTPPPGVGTTFSVDDGVIVQHRKHIGFSKQALPSNAIEHRTLVRMGAPFSESGAKLNSD